MQRIHCGECGKSYDYGEDAFCPHCGAFNQPARSGGGAVRVEGLDEGNHKGSFLHQEFHKENWERRFTGLSKGVRRTVRSAAQTAAPQRKREGAAKRSPLSVIVWVILGIVVLNMLSGLLFLFI